MPLDGDHTKTDSAHPAAPDSAVGHGKQGARRRSLRAHLRRFVRYCDTAVLCARVLWQNEEAEGLGGGEKTGVNIVSLLFPQTKNALTVLVE